MPVVDQRWEFLSIVLRLAKAGVQDDTVNPVYTKMIDKHFSRYSEHAFVKYIRQLDDSLQNEGVDMGSWELPSLAVHLSLPPDFIPSTSLMENTSEDVWDNRTLLNATTAYLAREFYKDAECAVFFNSQQDYYNKIRLRFVNQEIRLNKEWMQQFFSLAASENYYAIFNLQGSFDGAYLRVNNPGKNRETYTIFVTGQFDKNGIPVNWNREEIFRTNLHEYIHAFTNQLVDKYKIFLKEAAELILRKPEVFELMKNTFYGNWEYLLYESMVRACSIKYLVDNKEPDVVQKEIRLQEKAGFFWINQLVNELSTYGQNRDKYKTLESFMPRIVQFFQSVAAGEAK